MWICKNVRCSGQELSPFFSAEFESLVSGLVGTEPGPRHSNLQMKKLIQIHTNQHFWSFFNNANKKARDPSALILPTFQTEMQ